jgi:hypothetical protein
VVGGAGGEVAERGHSFLAACSAARA